MTLKFPNIFLKYLFLISVSFSLILIAFIDINGEWEHLLFHSSIEAGGATVAIMLAVMLLMVDTFHTKGTYILFGVAFLSMGILDAIHAVLSPGHSFVFYHSVSSLVGSLFFILIWSKKMQKLALNYKFILIGVAITIVVLIATLLFENMSFLIPAMLDEEKKFTQVAVLINTLAGILFLLTAVKLLIDYVKYDNPDDFIFFALTLFFGVAEMIFNFSSLWEYEWWLWHFLRLFSYVLVLYFIALEIKKQKNILDYQAHHDALTGLPNRILFDDRLRKTIVKSKRENSKFALLFLDLDHFKDINDTYGHHIGDDILKAVTSKLNATVREEDTISRLGGDEFTIIMEELTNSNDASILAQKILEVLSHPISINEHYLNISTSIGISIYPDNGTTCEDLLRFSDTAMYKSKDEGRNNFQYYTSEMTEVALSRIHLESSFKKSLANEDFVVYYQPQIDATDDTLTGMEALVRWNHPNDGLIAPYKFIPMAESTGLIVELDRFVMRSAIKQFVAWYRQGLNPGVLSINLAMQQLYKDDFLPILNALLEETQCKTEWLDFEVTEGGIMLNPENCIDKLNQIANMGIKISVDDFGTGYSSLAYLKKLPVDKLKIDREFVKDLSHDEDDRAIIKAIIALATTLNLEVIAEGVETIEEKDFLLANGCKNIQGYLYAKPMPYQDIEEMLYKLS